MRPRKVYRGFTLIELIVSIGIIALLLCVLMPAVMNARAIANVRQCGNNLRQIGLALHSYHETLNTFPPGYASRFDQLLIYTMIEDGDDGIVGVPDNDLVPFLLDTDLGWGWGWGAMILDHLDQAPLKSQLNFAANIAGQSAASSPLPVFLCPADDRMAKFTASNLNKIPLGVVGRSNYIGMYGTGEIPDFPDQGEGILFRNSSVRIGSITDGTSNTIVVGERASNLALSTWTGAVTTGIVKNLSGIPGSYDQPCPVFVLGHTGTAIEGQLPNNTTGHADDFTSRHAGGVNFLFADGSVRFVGNNIDAHVWVALGTRAGSETEAGDF